MKELTLSKKIIEIIINMRSYALVLAPVLAAIAIPATPSYGGAPAGYVLHWSDEFNQSVGSSPSSGNWTFVTGGGGFGNNELETYVTDTNHCGVIADSAATDGKALQITATSNPYQSCRIHTQGKHSVTYGYIEARARTTTGTGAWPAFWMLGNEFNGGNWPQCGEMDIMEYIGNSTEQSSFHMGTASNRIDWGASFNTGSPGSYHTYGLLWTSSGVTSYVDGTQFETHSSSSPGWIFNKPFFYILNMAIGGGPPGNPTGNPGFPWHYAIDYVREYEPGTTSSTSSSSSSSSSSSGGTLSAGVHTLTPQNATATRLDDTNGGTTNGNGVQIWTAGVGPNQNWTFVSVGTNTWTASANGVCLDDMGGAQGTQAAVWTCNGGTNQKWTSALIGSTYTFKSGAGLCLDVVGNGASNGTKVDTWACNGQTNQAWAVH